MKQTRRVPALLLAMIMVFSLTLTSCGKKEAPIAADQVAVSLFNMILKDDASSAVELFGYTSEADARADMGLDGSLYEDLADEVVSQFTSMGITASSEDAQEFVNAFLSMFKNVEMTAKVKESDEKAGTAVVTCTISTFDSQALNDTMMNAMSEAMADPDVMASVNSGDTDAAFSAILKAISGAISGISPSGETADFDVDFELQTLEINGKNREAWLPKDAEQFGNLISTTAMGG